MDRFVKQGPGPVASKASTNNSNPDDRKTRDQQQHKPQDHKQKSSKAETVELISDDDKGSKAPKYHSNHNHSSKPSTEHDLGKRNPGTQPSSHVQKASGAISSDQIRKSGQFSASIPIEADVKRPDPEVDKMYAKVGERMGLSGKTTHTHHPSSRHEDPYKKLGSPTSSKMDSETSPKSKSSQQTPPPRPEKRLEVLNKMITQSLFAPDGTKPEETTTTTQTTQSGSETQEASLPNGEVSRAKQTAPGVIAMTLPSDSEDDAEKKKPAGKELVPGKDFKPFLSGMSIVFTGMFRCTGNSDDKAPLQEAVRKLGGTASTTVNSKTLYLVAGYALPDGRETSTSKKYEAAVAKSIRILDEIQFSQLVKEQSGTELSRLLGPASENKGYSVDGRYPYKPANKQNNGNLFNAWKPPKTSPKRKKDKLNAGEIPSDLPINPLIIHPKPPNLSPSPVAQAISSVFPKTLKNIETPESKSQKSGDSSGGRKAFHTQPTVSSINLNSSPNIQKLAESAAAFQKSGGFAAGYMNSNAMRAGGMNCPLFPGSLSVGGGGLWSTSSNPLPQQSQGNASTIEEEPKADRPPRVASSTWAYPERPQLPPVVQGSGELWTSKYSPPNSSEIIGNADGATKLKNWLRVWRDSQGKEGKPQRQFGYNQDNNSSSKAVLISGPPGIGKTTSVRLVCKELGFELIQQNASDVRSKKTIQGSLGVMTTTRTINADGGLVKKTVILMDEVDGMTSDRGGVATLSEFIRNTKAPVVCICNDRNHPKMRTLAGNCYDIKFHRPAPGYLGPWIESVLAKEGIHGVPGACERLAEEFNSDVRSILSYLQNWARKGIKKFTFGNAESSALHNFIKDSSVSLTNFDAATALLNKSSRCEKTSRQLMEYFFIDMEFVPLLVHENYLNAGRKENDIETLRRMSRAADCFVKADMSNLLVRRDQHWKLLDTVAFYSSILPCHLFTESIHRCNFPEFLGKFSSERKMQRELRELKEALMKSSTGGEMAIKFDYAPTLWQLVKFYMGKGDEASLNNLLQLYDTYDLTPELVKEHLVDVIFNPQKVDLMEGIDSKYKAAFTRIYNQRFKESIVSRNRRPKPAADFDAEGDGEVADEEGEGSEDDDASSDFKIEPTKVPKKAGKPAANKKAPATSGQAGAAAKRK